MSSLAKISDIRVARKKRLQVVEKTSQSNLLIKVANERCSVSFQALFDHFSTKIFQYGMANQLSEAQSHDLVQEVMTLVWTKAHLFNSEKGNASTWIFTIARNSRFDMLRKRVRENKVISSESLWNEDRPIDVEDPKANLEDEQFKKELSEHIDQLSPVQKDVIMGVYFMGLTQEEYAEKNNLPLGTVKSRIRLAIRKLNQYLEPV